MYNSITKVKVKNPERESFHFFFAVFARFLILFIACYGAEINYII